VVAIVKRGSGSTLVLHDVKARVTYAGGIPDFRSLPESERLPASAETETRLASAVRLRSVKVAELLTVAYSERDSEKPLLNLAPGDEMQFATVYEVDQTKPYIVEVAVVGKSLGSWKRSQWRASDISLPRVT